MFVLTILASAAAALGAPPTVSDLGTPAAAGAGEPFVFATRDGLLLSWLEPAANAKEMALRFAVYRAGQWSQPRTVVQRRDLFVNRAAWRGVTPSLRCVLPMHTRRK